MVQSLVPEVKKEYPDKTVLVSLKAWVNQRNYRINLTTRCGSLYIWCIFAILHQEYFNGITVRIDAFALMMSSQKKLFQPTLPAYLTEHNNRDTV